MNKKLFIKGLRDGLPIALGYLAVSFGFGTLAASSGISAFEATLISLTNLTSAGQFAGLSVIVESQALWQMVLTQLVINSRYFLMGLSLSQKIGKHASLPARFAMAFVNTDEIFATAMSVYHPLTPIYMAGLGLLPIVGWTSGTLLGALAGNLLPTTVGTALGVAIYGMFIAVFIPKAREEKPVLAVVLAALVCSFAFYYIPLLNSISSGLSVVICTVIASVLGALLFPIKDEQSEESEVAAQ
ncbi:MAG: AzlC family ABC transporter permease [Clostridia bacterium]|nr:AzlC family ABC transporter permease [Clostridia bacterium]